MYVENKRRVTCGRIAIIRCDSFQFTTNFVVNIPAYNSRDLSIEIYWYIAEKLSLRTFCTVYTHIVGQPFPGKHIIGNLKLIPPRASNNKKRESVESNRTKMFINHYFITPKINSETHDSKPRSLSLCNGSFCLPVSIDNAFTKTPEKYTGRLFAYHCFLREQLPICPRCSNWAQQIDIDGLDD